VVAHGGQQWACGDLTRGHQLFQGKDLNRLPGIRPVHIGDNGMGGAENDTDEVT
jgi:hypothetical protein